MPGISAEDQAQVDHYRRQLYTTRLETDPLTQQLRPVAVPTPMRQAYEAGKQAYEAATRLYGALRLGASTGSDAGAVLDFAQNAPLYRRQVQAALSDWIARGYKNEVEQMEAFIAQATGEPPIS